MFLEWLSESTPSKTLIFKKKKEKGKSSDLKVSVDRIFHNFCLLLRFMWEMVAANDQGVLQFKLLLLGHYDSINGT